MYMYIPASLLLWARVARSAAAIVTAIKTQLHLKISKLLQDTSLALIIFAAVPRRWQAYKRRCSLRKM